MSDPFDVLRTESLPAAPDVTQIKGRARRIQQRQRMLVGGSAVSVAVVAIIAIVLSTGPARSPTNLAQNEINDRTSTSDADTRSSAEGGASTGSAPEGYEDTTDDTVDAPAAPEAQSRAGDNGAQGSGGTAVAGSGSMGFTEEFSVVIKAESQPLGGARFSLEVCNTTGEQQVRSFGTAQRYDFVVKRKGEDELWRWSDGRVFAQTTGEETWASKECKTWTDTWNGMTSSGGRAPDGDYYVRGGLTSDEPLASEALLFCHGLC